MRRSLSFAAPRADAAPVRKVFAIAVIVGLVWAGITLFTEGSEGLLAWVRRPGAAQTAAHQPSPLERIRSSGERARDHQMERIERQDPDAAPARD